MFVSTAIELFGVAVIVLGVVVAAFRFVGAMLDRSNRKSGRGAVLGEIMRGQIGRTLLLGLEILVAADVIETVALDPTLEHIATLGLLVVVRTFLSWSIILELEGRWPWQKPAGREASAVTEAPAAGG
jgi:uncharacterized membrane protein